MPFIYCSSVILYMKHEKNFEAIFSFTILQHLTLRLDVVGVVSSVQVRVKDCERVLLLLLSQLMLLLMHVEGRVVDNEVSRAILLPVIVRHSIATALQKHTRACNDNDNIR